jgi:hypothetical protein
MTEKEKILIKDLVKLYLIYYSLRIKKSIFNAIEFICISAINFDIWCIEHPEFIKNIFSHKIIKNNKNYFCKKCSSNFERMVMYNCSESIIQDIIE